MATPTTPSSSANADVPPTVAPAGRVRTGPRRHLLWTGLACLLAGVAIGRLFAPGVTADGAAAQHVWTAAVPADPTERPVPAAGVPSPGFADVVARVEPGVVMVSALLPFAPAALGRGDAPAAGAGDPVDLHPVAGATDEPGALAWRRSAGVRHGSGFLVNASGLVLTARHVVLRAARLVVDVPQYGQFDADLVGEDELTDLAVLRLVDPPAGLQALELGHSESLRAGDWIVAIGNPHGFSQTVTAGVVSFVGRHLRHYDLRVTNDFLQFSAQVSAGSSGSPVLDLSGRVVGVTTQAAEAAQGISFAIPSRTLKWLLDAMDRAEDGRVERGYLGIEFETPTGTDADGRPRHGALVRRVAIGEPAHDAGLRAGDLVLELDDRRIADAGDLHDRITRTAPGTLVRLVVSRGGRVLPPVEVRLSAVARPQERTDGDLPP